MKRILLYTGGVLALLVGLFLVVAAMQSDTLEVKRSTLVRAAPADVFPYVDDFDRWAAWNPWREMDPEQKEVYSDVRRGAGAWYTWSGNKDVGSGRMEIVESVPNEKVVMDLRFVEPFESRATVTLRLDPEGDGTRVTWGFHQKKNLMLKAFALFVDMDSMLGADFERGLNYLRPLAEKDAAERVAAEEAARAEAEAAQAAAEEMEADAAP